MKSVVLETSSQIEDLRMLTNALQSLVVVHNSYL